MKKAFTLIELLVVMALLGILTIIAVSQFKTAIIKGRDSQRKADLSSLSKSLLYYFADYHKFPVSSANGLIELDGRELEWGEEFSVVDSDGKVYIYMKKLPKENHADGRYIYPYCYVSDGTSFQLYGKLENVADKNITGAYENKCGVGDTGYNFGYSSPDITLDVDLSI
jgi:prepilin-type N-terminal cleavage/methylation domain-containing protein